MTANDASGPRRWGSTLWEDDEHIITLNGEPVGFTVPKRDGPRIAAWLNDRSGGVILLGDHEAAMAQAALQCNRECERLLRKLAAVEKDYKTLCAAVNEQEETCDEKCDSWGHSDACTAKDTPAFHIINLQRRIEAVEKERDEAIGLLRQYAGARSALGDEYRKFLARVDAGADTDTKAKP